MNYVQNTDREQYLDNNTCQAYKYIYRIIPLSNIRTYTDTHTDTHTDTETVTCPSNPTTPPSKPVSETPSSSAAVHTSHTTHALVHPHHLQAHHGQRQQEYGHISNR